jgi:hypothetical protein
MARNQFRVSSFEQHAIEDADGTLVGHIRVEPNRISWKASAAKHWKYLTLTEFAKLANEHGKTSTTKNVK